jgi:hypothetical protein
MVGHCYSGDHLQASPCWIHCWMERWIRGRQDLARHRKQCPEVLDASPGLVQRSTESAARELHGYGSSSGAGRYSYSRHRSSDRSQCKHCPAFCRDMRVAAGTCFGVHRGSTDRAWPVWTPSTCVFWQPVWWRVVKAPRPGRRPVRSQASPPGWGEQEMCQDHSKQGEQVRGTDCGPSSHFPSAEQS